MKQKLLKWITALSSCLVLLLLCGVHVQAAEYSISANDSWVSGSTEKEEVNYYTFTIPSAGRVTVTYQSYMSYGRCYLYDKDLVKQYRSLYQSGSAASPSTGQFNIDLEAGAYSLKLYGDYSEDSSYRVKVSFVPAHNNEKEPNNAFGTAMPLANGSLVNGFLSEDDSIDFYKFSIGEGATIRTTVSRGTLSSRYGFSVWDSDLMEVGSYNSTEQTKVWEKYLAPGTYYIKIYRYYAGSDYTGTYTLKWEGFRYVQSIQLKKSALTLEKGKSYSLFQSISPTSANNKNIQWTSDNTAVAKVDSSGKVTAKGIGAATIKAAAMDGSKVEATCQIVVKPTITQITKCKKSKDRNVIVKVKAQKNVSGIQYQLSRNKNFKGKKSSYYAGATETKATTATLKKNKTYYFRARMYIDYGGKRYYGAWSQVKSVKTGKKTTLTGYYSWKDA